MNKHTIVAGMVALVSAIMSPLWVRYGFEDYGKLRLFLDGMFYQFDCYVFIEYRLMFYESWGLIGQFTLWAFRLMFIYQLVRFYEGKTTTGPLFLAGMLGETPAILHVTYTMMMGFVGHIFPLPLHLLVAWVFLRVRPPPEISTPWVEVSDASDS
jgi:hypothetical protein